MLKSKRLLIATFMVAQILSPFSPAFAEVYLQAPAPGFCVQNFNMYGPAYATETVNRTERVAAELLGRSACDVIHLQEVWTQKHIRQVKSLLSQEYDIADPNSLKRIGLMSLYQQPIEDQKTYLFRLNNDGGVLEGIRDMVGVEKAFHVVVSEPRELGEKFYFVNTHLHPTSSELRLTQILDLLIWRLEHQDHKLILTGDFNSDPGSLEHDLVLALLGAKDSLKEFWGGYPEGACSYCRENARSWLPGNHLFDYIYFSEAGGNAGSYLSVETGAINLRGTPRSSLSDHYGVRVDFLIKQGRGSLTPEEYSLRKERAFVALTQVEGILKAVQRKDFDPYKEFVQNLKSQLSLSQGPFAEYLAK
jgi:endonuclease/exonuclease/phosphatase family metal-dependent hydrolase